MLFSTIIYSVLSASLATAIPTNVVPDSALTPSKVQPRQEAESSSPPMKYYALLVERTCANYQDGAQWIPLIGNAQNLHMGYDMGAYQACTTINTDPSLLQQVRRGEEVKVQVSKFKLDSEDAQIWLSDDVAGYMTVRVHMTGATVDWDFDRCWSQLYDAFSSGDSCFGKERVDTIGGRVKDADGIEYEVTAFKAT